MLLQSKKKNFLNHLKKSVINARNFFFKHYVQCNLDSEIANAAFLTIDFDQEKKNKNFYQKILRETSKKIARDSPSL